MKKQKRLSLIIAVEMLSNTGIIFLLFCEMFIFEAFRKVTGDNDLIFIIILITAAIIMFALLIAALCIYGKMKNRLKQSDEMTERLIYKAGWKAFRVVSAFCIYVVSAVMVLILVLSMINSDIKIADILDFRYMLLLICLANAVGNLTFFVSAFTYDKKGGI